MHEPARSKEKGLRVVYPFPMNLSLGFSYMLSIGQFVNALARYCDVDLLSLDDPAQVDVFFNNVLGQSPNERLRLVQLSNRRFGIRSNRLFFLNGVRQHVEALLVEGYQVVVYGRDYKQLAGMMRRLPRRPGLRYVFESHQVLSQNYCRNGKFKEASAFRKLEREVFSAVDGLVPITSTLSREIERIFEDVTSARIVLPVGVADSFFEQPRVEHYSHDVTYSGNFSRWKGVDTLIEAIARVHQDRPALKVLMVGAHDHQMPRYQELISRLDLEDVVELRGRMPLKNVPGLLASSRVGVVAISYQEDGLLYTSPLKLYEYLASGLAVVAARVPSLISALPNGLVHWAVPDDAASYAEAIGRALDETEETRKGRVDYAAAFTWERRGERLVDFLQSELNWD